MLTSNQKNSSRKPSKISFLWHQKNDDKFVLFVQKNWNRKNENLQQFKLIFLILDLPVNQ